MPSAFNILNISSFSQARLRTAPVEANPVEIAWKDVQPKCVIRLLSVDPLLGEVTTSESVLVKS